MWEFIDKVIYINLDHREDRRIIMKTFFEKGNIPSDKIIRFSAIKYSPGIIGSAKSHIGCLKLAIENKWKNVLILEDDLEWVNFEDNYKKLENIILNKGYDVCLLGGMYIKTSLPDKIHMSAATCSYVVNSHYYDTLLSNFETGLSKKLNSAPIQKLSFRPLKEEDRINFLRKNSNEFNIDIYWIKLQLKDNWIGIIDPMCKQADSYSDNLEDTRKVENTVLVYNYFFQALEYLFNDNLL